MYNNDSTYNTFIHMYDLRIDNVFKSIDIHNNMI